jgi:hypothetical protein
LRLAHASPPSSGIRTADLRLPTYIAGSQKRATRHRRRFFTRRASPPRLSSALLLSPRSHERMHSRNGKKSRSRADGHSVSVTARSRSVTPYHRWRLQKVTRRVDIQICSSFTTKARALPRAQSAFYLCQQAVKSAAARRVRGAVFSVDLPGEVFILSPHEPIRGVKR